MTTVLGWLHHSSRALLRLNSYLTERDAAVKARDEAVAERDAAHASAAAARAVALLVTLEAVSLVQQAQQHAEGCRAVVDMLIEPGQRENCSKVRLRDEEEAWWFASRVEGETGIAMGVHKCKFCPRQPVSLEPFWHITHADKALRGKGAQGSKPQVGNLAQHVTPADVARMRDRARGEAS